ncbi:Hint domain-containing protein [Pseudosulfitobacter sp. DSM 107133]|uniref:Hint domain-containing protein n=1 Tax=Pseudosulfitobacter sp. DSM 107133 TaxID=2883100 RepID=UPI000DF19A01|nr:Hint domain-containing protein [Pseudosulfitobacter sp. DSM 107133]UOA27177.1 hypothetical protein DSM107133_01894 [Pseudosulfitobacter sp. DSM 107133]
MAEQTINIISANNVSVIRDHGQKPIDSSILNEAQNGDAFSWRVPHDLSFTFSSTTTGITFDDADGVLGDDPYSGSNVVDQRLTQPVTIDGTTYTPNSETVRWQTPAPVTVENEYEVTLYDDVGNQYRMVGVSITQGYSTRVVGVTFDGAFPPPGTTLHYIQGVSTYAGTGQTLALPSAPVCFLAGTLIETPDGPQAIEILRVGMQVMTLDGGAQDIRWIGRNAVCGLGNLAPICIRAGALENRRDLFVSPNHRILLRSGMAELSFGEGDVLVPAKALVNGTTIVRMPMLRADYLHLMLEEHDLVFSEGIATETLFAGNVTLSVLGAEAMAELNLIFPDFRDLHHSTSHMGLTLHEAHYLRSVSCSGVQAVPLDAG